MIWQLSSLRTPPTSQYRDVLGRVDDYRCKALQKKCGRDSNFIGTTNLVYTVLLRSELFLKFIP